MTATAEAPQTNIGAPRTNGHKPRRVSLETYRQKYAERKDGFKYEFNNGIIEKTPSNMKIKQAHIVRNLQLSFLRTKACLRGDALITEVEMFTSPNQMRKPDWAHVTYAQMLANDEKASNFVIEIISPTDRHEDVLAKLREYFWGGVEVVWHINPSDATVAVYTAPTRVSICEGHEICSAAPAVPDFELTANAVFAK